MSPTSWFEIKRFAEHASGVSMDAMHVVVGVLLFLVLAGLFRSGIGSFRPWLTLLLLELANEVYDLRVERWPSLGHQLGEGARDLLLTMALPTLLALVARFRPGLLAGRSRLADDQVTGGPEVAVAPGTAPRPDDEHEAHDEQR